MNTMNKINNDIFNKLMVERKTEINNNFFMFDTVNDDILFKLETLLKKKFSKDEDKFLHFGDHEQEQFLEEQYNKYYGIEQDEIDEMYIEQYENHFLDEFKNERYEELNEMKGNLHHYNYFYRVFKVYYKQRDIIINRPSFPYCLYEYINKLDNILKQKLLKKC
jgi:hypothetical protein